MPDRYALMWSGGKDSALALDRASRSGIEVARLISFYDSATRRVRFHATRVEMLDAQAAAIGIELRAIPTSWPEMDANLQSELASLRDEGFTGVVFGDIHLADVRAWYEERVTAAGLEHVEPIWGEPPPLLLGEFIASGGRAVITCVDLAKLDEAWLGRVIDESFASEIARTGADACGENGEYHSFAFTGPVFKQPVAWKAGERRMETGFAQLDLMGGVLITAPLPHPPPERGGGLAPIVGVEAGLEPVNDGPRLRPVLGLASRDQLAQGVGVPGEQRFGA